MPAIEQIVDTAKSALGMESNACERDPPLLLWSSTNWNAHTERRLLSIAAQPHADTGRNESTGPVSMPLPVIGDSGARQVTSTTQQTSAFDPAYITVVYVLGGPGAGKGTQCAKLVAEKSFVHLSAGDLLRAEQNREGSEVGQLIRGYIREGTIVPMEITIGLLKTAMQEVSLALQHTLDRPRDAARNTTRMAR